MKSLLLILRNFRNLLPYFLLISIYFFFVNLEARKIQKGHLEKNSSQNDEQNINSSNDNNIKIRIPIIPYKQK